MNKKINYQEDFLLEEGLTAPCGDSCGCSVSWLLADFTILPTTPHSSTLRVQKYCDPIYPRGLWFIQKGNINNTDINVRFRMRIT